MDGTVQRVDPPSGSQGAGCLVQLGIATLVITALHVCVHAYASCVIRTLSCFLGVMSVCVGPWYVLARLESAWLYVSYQNDHAVAVHVLS